LKGWFLCEGAIPSGASRRIRTGRRFEVKGVVMGFSRRPAAWTVVFAVAVASVLMLPAAAPAATRTITGSCSAGCKWRPRVRWIKRGGTIVWQVPDGDREHNVTAFQSGGSRAWTKNTDIDPGTSTSRRFWKAGVYRFFCEYHPATMRGFIRVTR
jgi:plastocyanin